MPIIPRSPLQACTYSALLLTMNYTGATLGHLLGLTSVNRMALLVPRKLETLLVDTVTLSCRPFTILTTLG